MARHPHENKPIAAETKLMVQDLDLASYRVVGVESSSRYRLLSESVQSKKSFLERRRQEESAFHSAVCSVEHTLYCAGRRAEKTRRQRHSQILLNPMHDRQNHPYRPVDSLGTDDGWKENGKREFHF